jgi:hypothetical protein
MRIWGYALAILLCSCSDDPLVGGADAAAGADAGVAADTGVNVPSFASIYDAMRPLCIGCHAPGAPGRISGTELTLDFTTRETAYESITTGTASGLSGIFAVCNGVPLAGASAGDSLILATVDSATRNAFDLAAFPSCDAASISRHDSLGRAGDLSYVPDLVGWLNGGTPDN